MEFKDRIRSLRETRGVSAAQLAGAFEKSEGAIRMWETGRTKPDADTLIKLAEYFDCTTDYLLGRTEYKNIETKESSEKLIGRLSEAIQGIPLDVRESIISNICNLFEALSKMRDSCLFDEHLMLIRRLFNNISYIENMALFSTSMDFVEETLGSEVSNGAISEMMENFPGMEIGAISTLKELCDSTNTAIKQSYKKQHGADFERSSPFSLDKFIEWSKWSTGNQKEDATNADEKDDPQG